MSAHIRSSVVDGVGRIVLDRPRAINALSLEMLEDIAGILDAWATDDGVESVELSGAGERGFCAGADVRELAGILAAGGPWLRFLETEYALDARVAQFPKPVTAALHGVTMGGGLGLVAHADHRIVDSSTIMAMPETKIGFFPDAGVSWHLARGGAVGTHIALTSATFSGGDAIHLGLADESSEGELHAPLVEAAGEWIDDCYSSDDPLEILERLSSSHHADARRAATELRARSPLAVHVALRALRRAATLDPAEVYQQDLRLAERMLPIDFPEGVRALLVDKDNNPEWRWARLEDVPTDAVDEVFAY